MTQLSSQTAFASPTKAAFDSTPVAPGGTGPSSRRGRWQTLLWIGMLGAAPALLLGAVSLWRGYDALSTLDRLAQSSDLPQEQVQDQRQQLLFLFLGAIATAGLSSGLAIALLRRFQKSQAALVQQVGHQKSAQVMRLMTNFSQRLQSQRHSREILGVGVEEVRQLLNAHRVVVIGLDDQTQGSVVVESVQPGYPRALEQKVSDPCFAERAALSDSVKAIPDVSQSSLPPCYLKLLEPLGVDASLSVPLRHRGRLGFLVAHYCDGPRDWSDSEIELFASLASQMGQALERAALLRQREALHHQLKEEAQWKGFMMDATQYIHESLTVEDVLDASVEEIRRVLESDRVVVYSVDRKTQGVIIAESIARGFPRTLGRTITDPCFEERYIQAYSDGRVRALDDIYKAGMTDCYIEQLEKIAVKANLVAPVIHEGKLLGLLVAHQCSAPRHWRDLEVRWFTQMAVQVGYALDNAKLVSRVDQMAQESSKMVQEQQYAAVAQLQVQQRLQTSQAALLEILDRTTSHMETLSDHRQALEAIANRTSLLRGTSKTVVQQFAQMKALIQREADTVIEGSVSLSELEDQLMSIQADLRMLGQTTQSLIPELATIRDLSGHMNQQALHATIQAGRSAAGPAKDSVTAATKQVLSLAQDIHKVTDILQPLHQQLTTIAANTTSHTTQGEKKLMGGKAFVQNTQQHFNRIQGMEDQLAHLMGSFDQQTSQQQHQIVELRQSLQSMLLETEQTRQQLEQLNAWLPINSETLQSPSTSS